MPNFGTRRTARTETDRYLRGELSPDEQLPAGLKWGYEPGESGFFGALRRSRMPEDERPLPTGVQRAPQYGGWDAFTDALGLFGTATIGGMGAAQGLGGGAQAAGQAGGYTPPPLAPLTRDITAPLASAGSGGGSGAGSMLGKLFKGGLDPTMLLLSGLSFLGGDENDDNRQSFAGTGADPVRTLTELFEAIRRLSGSLADMPPPSMSSSFVPRGPEPISVPGVPFQIGGGMGVDPALGNPGMLTGPNPIPSPFGNRGQAVPRGGVTPQPGARRRPAGGF